MSWRQSYKINLEVKKTKLVIDGALPQFRLNNYIVMIQMKVMHRQGIQNLFCLYLFIL